jgi:hypothetical protein
MNLVIGPNEGLALYYVYCMVGGGYMLCVVIVESVYKESSMGREISRRYISTDMPI